MVVHTVPPKCNFALTHTCTITHEKNNSLKSGRGTYCMYKKAQSVMKTILCSFIGNIVPTFHAEKTK